LDAFTHNIVKRGNSLETINTNFAEGPWGNREELTHAVPSCQQHTPQIVQTLTWIKFR